LAHEEYIYWGQDLLSRPTTLLTPSSGHKRNCRGDKNSWLSMTLYGITKIGRHNQVADALNKHVVIAIVIAIVQVELDMLGRLRQATREDTSYKKLVDLV
jgi:hypothetical protein